MKIYGIKTCDTCRKAIKAFKDGERDHVFVDLRADAPTADLLDRWLDAVGWEVLLNRRSTSWRALPDADKANPDHASARRLMLANPTLIKRPVFDDGGEIIVGFGKTEQARLGL